MQLDLGGKIALITGGSKGIGFACAQGLQAEGAKVFIVSRNQNNIDSAMAALPGAVGYTADMSSATEAARLIEVIETEHGPIDILVNCAGAAKRTPVDALNPDLWRAAMDAKYFTYINAIDPVIKRMAERQQGVIVNVIGAGGKVASPVHLAGGAANAALMLATAGLANAYAAHGVRVVGINPGSTQTERLTQRFDVEAESAGITVEAAMAKVLSRIPLGRMATPAEIANMVTFLSSPRASYVTGVTINMDGSATPMVV